MEEELNGQRYHLASYGLALLRHLKLPWKMSQKDYLKEKWHEVYQECGQDPIETVIEFYGNLFLMIETIEKRLDQDSFERRRESVLRRVEEAGIRGKYESGDLDRILIEQEKF